MDCPPEEQLRVLRWLAGREPGPVERVLWDADLMADLGWTQERAQSMLAALRTRGDLVCKDVILEGGGYAIGSIRFTAAGLQRLADADAPAPRSLLARLTAKVSGKR
jgi:hypothetical protein